MCRHALPAAVAILGLFGLLLVLHGGCSTEPLSRPSPPQMGDPRFVQELPPSPEALVQGRLLPPNPVPDGPVDGTTTLVIDGSAGGALSCGRFALIIPPGAFRGTEAITIEHTSDLYVECKLGPEGLQFDVPVTLVIDLANTSGDAGDATVYWYDPNPLLTLWVDIGGAYDPVTHTIATELAHFSTFRPGRTGW